MYQHTKPVSEFSEGKCVTPQWNDELQTVVTSVVLISSDIHEGDVITLFENEPTSEELTALNNLAETIVWAA